MNTFETGKNGNGNGTKTKSDESSAPRMNVPHHVRKLFRNENSVTSERSV